ncbi:protein grindelwald [Anoplophora glabripennis]|uniref:protein grindelwald n=1 Tax=Anoplophora glabripennis TaxID=217634 RepID=UPI000873C295|nr:protein grindelwald [Anoplophora glabripennis]
MRGLCKFSLVVLVLCFFQCGQFSVTLGEVKCGQRTCKEAEYCSPYNSICEPCKGVCDNSSHNYDKDICEKSCQVYLFDQRYTRVGERGGEGPEDLRGTVQQLSRMVTVTLTLVCLMLLVLAAVLCFQLYRWKVKKNITFASIKNKLLGKKTQEDSTPSKNNVPMPETKKNDLRLDIMPATITHSDHSPVTVTTSISRRPAEDSTLDYAYDNHAMSNNPK